MLKHERQRKVGSYILGYLERELSLLNEGDVHNASSDPIESTFGTTKARMSNDKLTGVTPMILIMPLRIALADRNRRVDFDFKERLEKGRHRHIKEWTNENLSPNLTVKRINTLGKNASDFKRILNTLPEGAEVPRRVCQNSLILKNHKALTFTSQGFAMSKSCCNFRP